jgi:hypothetical protein
VRWTAPTTNETFNGPLRFGPDTTLYVTDPGTLACTRGPSRPPVFLAQQRRRTSKQQPLPGGLQLTATNASSNQ